MILGTAEFSFNFHQQKRFLRQVETRYSNMRGSLRKQWAREWGGSAGEPYATGGFHHLALQLPCCE